MRVGLLEDIARPVGDASKPALARLREAGGQGYDAVWLQDAASGGALSAQLLFVAAQLAALEGSPALGLCSQPSGSLHPLRVAEELAVLDIMTAGRLEWAMAPDAEGWEVLEIVLRAWRGEPFSHTGERHSIPEITCHPVPLREPHPAIWLADDASIPKSVPLEGHGRIVGMSARLCELDAAAVPRAIVRQVVLTDSRVEARETAASAVEHRLGRALGVDEKITDFAIVGDAAACREQVERLRAEHSPDILVVAEGSAADHPGARAEWQRAFAEDVLSGLSRPPEQGRP
ncbi:MAG: LLM class flavin-dependent oxidoreductase [Deltaproteobacteria bacterium]|nr:LLM class flavin-dependent oxidoreductase [Deltaproteobacteria bacterium]MBW2696605.1 LLM class flavin-dependent oxidoreductase [Deltaproteobacteria bacterium]